MTHPRRMLSLEEAAAYCSLPCRRFHVLTGISPIELPHGKKRYDIRDLDRWLDSLRTDRKAYDADSIVARLGS